MKLYVYLDKDYDLPMIVEDSARALSEKLGVRKQYIWESIKYCEKVGKPCRYLKLEIEDYEER